MAESYFILHAQLRASQEEARSDRNKFESALADVKARFQADPYNSDRIAELAEAEKNLKAAEVLVTEAGRKLDELEKFGPSGPPPAQPMPRPPQPRPPLVYTPAPVPVPAFKAPMVYPSNPPAVQAVQSPTIQTSPPKDKTPRWSPFGRGRREWLLIVVTLLAIVAIWFYFRHPISYHFDNAVDEYVQGAQVAQIDSEDTLTRTQEEESFSPKVPDVTVKKSHPPPIPEPTARASPEPISSSQPQVINIEVEREAEVVLPEATLSPTMVLDVDVEKPSSAPEPSPEVTPEGTKTPDIKVTVKPLVDKAEAFQADDKVHEEALREMAVQDVTLAEESSVTEVKSLDPVDVSTGSIAITSSQATPPPRVNPKDYGLPSIAERKAALKALEKVSDDVLEPSDEKFVPAVCLEMKRKPDVPVGYWKRVPHKGNYRIMEGWTNASGFTQKLQKLFLRPNQAPMTLLGGAIYTMPKSCSLEQAQKVYKKTPLPSWGGKGHQDDLRYLKNQGLMR